MRLVADLGDRCGDLPHDVFLNAEIVVDNLVAHADDVRPWDLRVLVRELPGHLAPGFPDDLNEMNQRETEILVRVIASRERPMVLLTAFFAMSSMCPT